MSESQSESDAGGSRRSSYSSESFRSDDSKQKNKAKKKDAQQNKGDVSVKCILFSFNQSVICNFWWPVFCVLAL